ncbi:MAG TPA: adenylate kinase [Candidatus Omnitrophica bacterium]|nr:adenylate kinase [Candidatus Omnitrophota bacterium]
MKILLLGSPGAGKGTMAEMVEKDFGILHLSSGDILREAVKQGTPLGKRAKIYIEKGELVPDELIVDIMKEKINDQDFILDGFPRNVNQAQKLEEANIKLDLVLNVMASEGTIIFRLSGRRVCKQCGKIYHLVNMPPRSEGICDICGGELIQREDDRPETIKRRLEVYREQSEELVNYYRDKGILKNIDANGNREKTYDKIAKLLWLKKKK